MTALALDVLSLARGSLESLTPYTTTEAKGDTHLTTIDLSKVLNDRTARATFTHHGDLHQRDNGELALWALTKISHAVTRAIQQRKKP